MATPESEAVLGELYYNTPGLVGPFQEINQEFVLASGYLVFFMHCGFAMVSQMSAASAVSWAFAGSPCTLDSCLSDPSEHLLRSAAVHRVREG